LAVDPSRHGCLRDVEPAGELPLGDSTIGEGLPKRLGELGALGTAARSLVGHARIIGAAFLSH
jgi:hypothetical protein